MQLDFQELVILLFKTKENVDSWVDFVLYKSQSTLIEIRNKILLVHLKILNDLLSFNYNIFSSILVCFITRHRNFTL